MGKGHTALPPPGGNCQSRWGAQVQPPPGYDGGWIWLPGSSGLTLPVPLPFQSKRDLLEQEMRRDKAALFPQPTLQLSREHSNTSQRATQGTCF